jgi:predicted permease
VNLLRRFRSLLDVLTARGDFEASMTQELRFHLEQYTADLVRSGISPEEAARRARLEFGGMNSVEGECRRARGLWLFDELFREMRHAARVLRNTPGFTATALLTLTLCIGANLTIFAAIDSVLLRPLPFPDPERLVTLFNTYPKAGVERDGSSLTNYYERRGRIPAFSSIAIYRYGTAIVGEAGATERAQVTQVSPDFFSTLGRGPAIGRSFTEPETTYKTDAVAILTDSYWRTHFRGDPQAIGKSIRVDGVPRIVVGVLPADFRFLSTKARLYFPLSSKPEDRTPHRRHSGGNVIQMIARLKKNATVADAQSQIDLQNAALEADDPQAKMMADFGFRSLVVPLHEDHVATIRPTLLLMQAGVLVLLLIGAVNLVNLLVMRASGRSKELAVRKALGASGWHVASEVLVETTLLTLTGGLLGCIAGAGGIRLLSALGADRLPLGSQIIFDTRLAIVALVGAIVLGLLLGAPIAWFNLRRYPGNALQSEGRSGTSSHATQRLRHSFIVAQIALAFVLLAGAGLLGLSLKRAMEVSPGFRSDHILTGQISLPWKAYPSAEASLEFLERLTGKLGEQPVVTLAGVVNNIPFSGITGKDAAKVKGRVPRAGESARGIYSYGVSGDYFKAMGLVLRAGRFLETGDSRRAERVCVVDEDFARYYWPHGSALGKRVFQGIEQGKDDEAFTVVGVVGSAKQAGLTDEAAQGAIYYPYIFRPDNQVYVVVRTRLSPESMRLTLQRVVRQIDSNLPVTDIQSMETRITDSLIARRSSALLGGLFSAMAVLLAGIGTYGTLSYAVAQRRREIGVRMALGARPNQIRSQFLSLALRLLAAGTLFGALGAWLTGEAMRTILFHVAGHDPTILVCTAGILCIVAIAACILPSRRAARIAPTEVLSEQ